jgi:S1-C subfamily serine protease
VTIELGNGHGSGFLISRDGYVLTNAHVVGEGKNVPVVFTNGLRISGRVLRVAKNRDVALVKVPIIADHILPISQKKPPIVLDTVYALGTPLKRGLQATLTKGVVSAHRKLRNEPYIQADVAITGGNSGGPLLDESGNVVGITVASFVRGQNLNLFIPIDDALKALNLDIVVE